MTIRPPGSTRFAVHLAASAQSRPQRLCIVCTGNAARSCDLRRVRPAPLLGVTRLRQTGAGDSTSFDWARQLSGGPLAPLLPVVETEPGKVLQIDFSGDGACGIRA
jgi:hypothetical protein